MKTCLCLLLIISSWPAFSNEKVTIFIQEYQPYISINNKELSGVSVDLLKSLFDRAGIEYALKSRPFKRAYETVLGNAHESEGEQCLFPMQATQENAADFKWIGPVMVTESGFFAKDTVIRHISELKGKTIGSYIGSVDGESLERLGFSVEYTRNTLLNALKVDADRMVALVEDIKVAEHILNKNKIEDVELVYPYKKYLNYLACGSTLSEEKYKKLESSLSYLYEDGSIKSLIKML
ncbi:hypothetical protein BZG76_02995 [Salinivibrio sp. AR647]|uniref:substrate-binding periplasmic protein n=1 Tax=Salinivibrio sp. AR647 TaxID=1909438 RepID=UPI000986389F|nr:transporter substrate-binding domain-containing protein [Salinivibrio sp. AR647]OOE93698.1 hypothetical protein BZG76_02995 [Salinivibrio sp. AR647]